MHTEISQSYYLQASRPCRKPLLQQSLHHRFGVEAAQIRVRLASSDEHDWLSCCVSHRDGGTDLQRVFHCTNKHYRNVSRRVFYHVFAENYYTMPAIVCATQRINRSSVATTFFKLKLGSEVQASKRIGLVPWRNSCLQVKSNLKLVTVIVTHPFAERHSRNFVRYSKHVTSVCMQGCFV